VRVVNPLFVLWPEEEPVPDPIDRFGNIDLAVAATESRMIGGGTAVFVNVPTEAPISLYFRLVEPSAAGSDGDGVVGGGCNDVPGFSAAAQPRLSQSCVSCHGGGQASAKSAVDMSMVND